MQACADRQACAASSVVWHPKAYRRATSKLFLPSPSLEAGESQHETRHRGRLRMTDAWTGRWTISIQSYRAPICT